MRYVEEVVAVAYCEGYGVAGAFYEGDFAFLAWFRGCEGVVGFELRGGEGFAEDAVLRIRRCTWRCDGRSRIDSFPVEMSRLREARSYEMRMGRWLTSCVDEPCK